MLANRCVKCHGRLLLETEYMSKSDDWERYLLKCVCCSREYSLDGRPVAHKPDAVVANELRYRSGRAPGHYGRYRAVA